ncbi:glycan biosynthesis hexose transferase WsfD [Paenibacillus soyae]|uniref:Transmembrane protein n=1 Tax=Paenibacillus soyae TaxID=2969249 RepID=A0A9X2MVT5_9BACL|nr:hypothetical protein [Paenibacillus soyae]MCR2807819.1 hypothetical protein [Paenibacillus soyae]
MDRFHTGRWTVRWISSFSRFVSPALLAAMLTVAIGSAALFVKPYVGMADNGDFYRILYGNGLYFNAPDYDGQYFGYFVRQYGIMQYFNDNEAALLSSQSLFIRIAVWLNKLLYSPHVFDIRAQGALYLALYTSAVYLLVESVTWKMPRKPGYFVALIAVFMFGDTGYTAYFHSFYGEAVVLIMTMLLAASGLLLCRGRYNDYAMLALFAVSALLLTAAKQQNAPVGVIAGVMGLPLLLIRRKAFRVTAGASLALLLLTGIAVYALIPQEFVNINQYHAMTRGPLLTSGNPEAALAAFGIDEQYAILAGSIYYELYTTVDVQSPILDQSFYGRYGFLPILGYYLAHPAQAVDMLQLAARHAFTIRPEAMGSFELAAGKPFGEHARFFTGYSELKQALWPKTIGFVAIWALAAIGFYAPSFMAAVKSKNMRAAMKLPLVVMIILIGLSSMAVSIIGAGDADLSKHEFLFTVTFDLILFAGLADVIRSRTRARERKGGGEG